MILVLRSYKPPPTVASPGRWAGTPLNARQAKVINPLLDGSEGKLTNRRWASIAHCSPDTALRDIRELLGLGLLHCLPGGGRCATYCLTDRETDAQGQAPCSPTDLSRGNLE